MGQAPQKENGVTPWGTYTPAQVKNARDELIKRHLPSEGECLAVALALRFPDEAQQARDKLVTRLKEEEEEERRNERPMYWKGRKAGTDWVFTHGKLPQLKRLRTAVGTEHTKIKTLVESWKQIGGMAPIATGLYWTISRDKRPDDSQMAYKTAMHYWGPIAPQGFELENSEYAVGFMTGALEVCDEVGPLVCNPWPPV